MDESNAAPATKSVGHKKKFPSGRFTKRLAELPVVAREEAILFLQRIATIHGVEDTCKQYRMDYAVICNSFEEVCDFASARVDYNGGDVHKFVDSTRIVVEEQTIIVRPGLPHLFAWHSHQLGDASAEYWF